MSNNYVFNTAVSGGHLVYSTELLLLPITLDFNPVTGAPLGVYAESNSVLVVGLIGAGIITIVGGEYSLNGGDFTPLPGLIYSGDVLVLRAMTSNSYSTNTTATVTVNGVVGSFLVSTVAESFTNPFDIVPYVVEANSRVTQQFKSKSVIERYIELINQEYVTLQEVLKDLMQKRSLETAEGAQLDILGDIVGQPRDLFESVLLYFFGYVGASGALSYGTVADTTTGGRYKSYYEDLRGSRYLDDHEYRALIKIKIKKNITKGTINEFIEMVRILYNVPLVTYTETDATITINIGRDFNDVDLSYFKGLDEVELARTYLPIPLGIRLEFDGTIL